MPLVEVSLQSPARAPDQKAEEGERQPLQGERLLPDIADIGLHPLTQHAERVVRVHTDEAAKEENLSLFGKRSQPLAQFFARQDAHDEVEQHAEETESFADLAKGARLEGPHGQADSRDRTAQAPFQAQ